MLSLITILWFQLESFFYNISCKSGLMNTHFLRFGLPRSLYLSFTPVGQLFREIYFSLEVLFFDSLSLSLHSFLACRFLLKSAHILVRVSFFSCCFKNSPFVSDFQQFDYNVFHWSPLSTEALWRHFSLRCEIFPRFGKFPGIIFLQFYSMLYYKFRASFFLFF